MFDDIKDPTERKIKLMENAQLMCRQSKMALAQRQEDGQTILASEDFVNLINTFSIISGQIGMVAKIDGITLK